MLQVLCLYQCNSYCPLPGAAQGIRQTTPSEAAISSATNSNASVPNDQAVRGALAQDSITIESHSGPWDGPHPGLASTEPSSGTRPRHRAALGLVRLPPSLLPTQSVNRSRPSSTQPAANVAQPQGHAATARQPIHSVHSAAAGSHGPQKLQHDQAGTSSALHMPADSSASLQHQHAASQAHTAMSGLSASGHSAQQANGASSAQPVETNQPASQQTSDGADTAARRDTTPSAQNQSQGYLDGAAATEQQYGTREAENSVGQGSAGHSGSQTQGPLPYPEGQLGDLPDRPGLLATVEACRVANGGVCWHLLQMAVKAREIARKDDTVREHSSSSVLLTTAECCLSCANASL